MEHFSSYESMFNYVMYNPLLGIAVLLLFALLIYKKPKIFLSVLAGVLLIAAILYFIFSLSDVGSVSKNKIINSSEGARQEKSLEP